MQVVFKGMDKSSVKFEYNSKSSKVKITNPLVGSDTAEEVVYEMIQEQVLPANYQQLITSEINRILREMNRPLIEDDRNREEDKQVWQQRPSIPDTSSVSTTNSSSTTELLKSAPTVKMVDSPHTIYPVVELPSPMVSTGGTGLMRKQSIIDYPELDDIPFIGK